MMKLYLTLTFFLLFTICLFSQNNLVPNPSFEKLNPLVKPENSAGVILIKSWSAANPGPGDYYYRNNPDKLSNVPDNIFGNQQPHTGNAYTGICLEDGFVEYIEAQLITPLVKGQEYKVSFFISKCDKRRASVKEMGVLFIDRKKEYFLVGGIKLKPQIEFINEEGYKNETEWTELSADYTAEGFETVIIIGHFLYNQPKGYTGGKAHYYIDDVSIIPINETSTDSFKISEVTVTTNQETVIDTFRLEDLNFKFGTDELEGDYDVKLKQAVNYLLNHLNKTVKVEGHTDNVGSEQTNNKLSDARAKAVANYLILKGIDKKRISYRGYGSSHPIESNNTDVGRKRNRRVDLIIAAQ